MKNYVRMLKRGVWCLKCDSARLQCIAGTKHCVLASVHRVSTFIWHMWGGTTNNMLSNGQRLASFLTNDYQLMYHLPMPKSYMDSHFYVITSYLSTKDVIKGWAKEPSKFCQIPNNTYKTKSLRKAYQYLIVLCCRIYGHSSTKTSPESWAFLLN